MECGYKTTDITSEKGAIGERICVEGWIKEGKLVYGLLNALCCPHCRRSLYGGSSRHFFDFLLMSPYPQSGDEVPLFSIQPTEVKTKKSLRGKISINRRDLNIYEQFIKSLYTHFKGAWSELNFTVVFVDDETGIVYQEALKEILQPCMIGDQVFPQEVPYIEKKKGFDYDNPYVWFSLNQFKKILKLSKNQIEELHGSSSRTRS